MVGQVLRPASEIVQRCLADINPQIVVHGGNHFSKMNGTVFGRLAVSIRGTDDLADLHSAARQQCR